MKIGILTASRTDNNGTDLQAFAMQKLFCRLGAEDVEIIDYICTKIDTKTPIKLNLRNLFFLPIYLYNRYSHRRFRKRNLNKSTRIYNKANVHTIPYDAVVVGSDQVWNLDTTGGDLSFFLPFDKPGFRKYSYAASLGTAKLDLWNENYNIKQYLTSFDCISVREKSGVEALDKMGISSFQSLDPILMTKPDDWLQFTMPAWKRNYILLYLVAYDSDAVMYAQKIADQKKCDVVMLNPGIKHWKGVKPYPFVSVERWINLVANADMVITNSYHGLSFSILFHREIRLCLLPSSSKNNARLLDLVDELHLTDCVLKKNKEAFKSIDWASVEERKMRIGKESEEYVKSIIGGV
jgi:hypothetical protein